jgi:hypothetical protein
MLPTCSSFSASTDFRIRYEFLCSSEISHDFVQERRPSMRQFGVVYAWSNGAYPLS